VLSRQLGVEDVNDHEHGADVDNELFEGGDVPGDRRWHPGDVAVVVIGGDGVEVVDSGAVGAGGVEPWPDRVGESVLGGHDHHIRGGYVGRVFAGHGLTGGERGDPVETEAGFSDV